MKKTATCENGDMIRYMYDISVQYNMDKRTIILSYFHFILEEYPHIVTRQFLNIISNLIHNTDVKTEHMVKYFLYQLNNYYSLTIDRTS